VISKQAYIKINRVVMTVIFFIPLMAIALFESQLHQTRSERLRAYFDGPAPEEEGDPTVEDPKCDEDDGEISRISFKDLTAAFPKCVEITDSMWLELTWNSTSLTPTTVIHRELISLRKYLDQLELEAHGVKTDETKKSQGSASEVKEEIIATKD
jgi:hypothetical protein